MYSVPVRFTYILTDVADYTFNTKHELKCYRSRTVFVIQYLSVFTLKHTACESVRVVERNNVKLTFAIQGSTYPRAAL